MKQNNRVLPLVVSFFRRLILSTSVDNVTRYISGNSDDDESSDKVVGPRLRLQSPQLLILQFIKIKSESLLFCREFVHVNVSYVRCDLGSLDVESR